MATTTEERKIKIILDGQQVNSSLKEMTAAQALMNNQLKKMSADDPGRPKLIADYRAMGERIKKAKEELYGVKQASGAAQAGFGGVTKASQLMKAGFTSAMGALLPLLGIQKVFAFLDDSKAKFETQANAVAQLEATLKSTGNAAGFTSQELQDMASSLQGKTIIGDEATIQAQSLLLTFTNIKKGVFEDAIPAIQDMATKMAGDGPVNLKGASIQLGKALNDPIKGVSALAEVGVSFTEGQKATIKSLVDMGDTAGAQKIILEELNKEFGGSAEAARKAGTGGYRAFMNTIGDLQELLGAKLGQALNATGNFFGEVIEKSAPLVEVFQDVWIEVTKLYNQFSGIIESLGIFSSEGDRAGGVVKFLSGTFTLLFLPIKAVLQIVSALTSGFIYLYNNFEVVRGGLGGLASAFVQLFTNIKENVMNTLGGVADILVGIFTLDTDKIKQGISKSLDGLKGSTVGLGRGVADSFTQGYAEGKDKYITVARKMEEEKQVETLAVAAETADKQVELTKEQLAKQKKEEEKHQEDLKKAREKYNEAYAKSEQELAKLKVEIMDDGVDKTLAKLKLQHEQELTELAKHRMAVLENISATEDEKKALLSQYDEQQKLKEEEYKAAQEEAKTEDKEEKYEKFLEDLDEEEALKAEAIQQQFINAVDAEFEREEALKELRRASLQEKLAVLEAAGKAESLEAMKLKTTLLQTEKEIADGRIANTERTAKAKADLEKMAMNTAIEAFQVGMDLLGKDTQARKIAGAALKAFTLGKIAMDLQQEIQSIWTTANANPSNILFPGSGAVIAGVKTAAAVGRSVMAARTVMAQQFAHGGNTVPMELVNGAWQMTSGHSGGSIGAFAAGGDVKSARLGLIGEAGAEWVMPNWMMRSPKYANTYRWLEAERQKGGVRAFAEGGTTAAAMPQMPQMPDSSAEMLQEMRRMRLEMAGYHGDIRNWASSLHVTYNAGPAQEAMELKNNLERSSGF